MQVVAPHLGFCVKAWTEPEAEMTVVYLNLCHHADVPEAVARPGAVPHDDDCGGHCNHDDARWEISYVLGPPRFHRTKGGSVRSVYDFVFGSKSLKRGQTDEQFRLVLLQTCYRALQEKLNINLAKKFVIAKKYAFKAPPERRVLVTEIEPAASPNGLRESSATGVSRAADYNVSQASVGQLNKFDYHVKISLPKLQAATNTSLHVTKTAIVFTAPSKYDLNIDLGSDIAIDLDTATSVFDQISSTMHVKFRATGAIKLEEANVPKQGAGHEHCGHDLVHNEYEHEECKNDQPGDYTRALALPLPFAPQQLELRYIDENARQTCFSRQTLREVTLVLQSANASDLTASVAHHDLLCVAFRLPGDVTRRLEVRLLRSVREPVHASVSSANIVLVLEKAEPQFWPALSPSSAQTSTALKF